MRASSPFKGYQVTKEIILQAVFWYCRYSLSYRDIEELMNERSIEVDHSTIQRWVEAFIPFGRGSSRKTQEARSWELADG